MSAVRVIISSPSIGSHVVRPTNPLILNIKRNGGSVEVSLKNDVVIGGVDYLRVGLLEGAECEIATIEFEVYCAGAFSLKWQGSFTWSKCSINKSKSQITIKPQDTKINYCLERTWGTTANIYHISSWVNVVPNFAEYEVECCFLTLTCGASLPPPITTCVDTNWLLKSNAIVNPTPSICAQQTCWHRVLGVGGCASGTAIPPTWGNGWTLLQNNCPTDSIWWKAPAATGPNGENEDFMNDIPYGMLLGNVLEQVFEDLGCGITVKSNFLNINPDGIFPQNGAYEFAMLNLQRLTIHQKSSVKRPDASNPATSLSYKLKPQDLVYDLIDMFNLDYRFDGTNFVLEHLSYFEDVPETDLTTTEKTLEYEHETGSDEAIETFQYMDELCSDYFRSRHIKYNCGKGTKEVKLRLLSVDIETMQLAASTDAIKDAGFVICATKLVSGQSVLIDFNRVLGWPKLHAALFMHGRNFKTGTINNVPVTFISNIPKKKAAPFTIPVCCDDTVNGLNTRYKTELGKGLLNEVDWDLEKNSANLIINYF
jgi:hypothetical protein